jgi:predicted PP-loop superfamily ATPase
MKLFGKCETILCHRRGFFVRRRRYWTGPTGWIYGKARVCGRCHRRIKAMVRNMNTPPVA